MAITIDWPTKVIYITTADMQVVQLHPIPIYQLDLNWFRLQLKALEETTAGIVYPTTHAHVAPLEVGGVGLARVVEIINGYTITFEDGQYAVNLTGANSNVGDRVNVNQVSVRSANSAGLTDVGVQSKLDYLGVIVIDPNSPNDGILYPVGTDASPVNNIDDAVAIAENYGIKKFKVRGTVPVNINVDGYTFVGDDYSASVSFTQISSCNFSKFFDIQISGNLSGSRIRANKCKLGTINNVEGEFINCGISGNIHIAPYGILTLDKCSGRTQSVIELDMNESNDSNLNIRGYSGRLRINHCDTSASLGELDMAAGSIELTNTCSDGILTISGNAELTDNSTGTSIDVDNKMSNIVWNHSVDVTKDGSFGDWVKNKLVSMKKYLSV